jgi:hypothetical protein
VLAVVDQQNVASTGGSPFSFTVTAATRGSDIRMISLMT